MIGMGVVLHTSSRSSCLLYPWPSTNCSTCTGINKTVTFSSAILLVKQNGWCRCKAPPAPTKIKMAILFVFGALVLTMPTAQSSEQVATAYVSANVEFNPANKIFHIRVLVTLQTHMLT